MKPGMYGEKSKKTRFLSFLTLALSRFYPSHLRLAVLLYSLCGLSGSHVGTAVA